MDEERPVHVIIDCHGSFKEQEWTVTEIPVTDEEWEEMKVKAAEMSEAQRKQQEEEENLRAAVAAHTDPVVQALAAKLGIV